MSDFLNRWSKRKAGLDAEQSQKKLTEVQQPSDLNKATEVKGLNTKTSSSSAINAPVTEGQDQQITPLDEAKAPHPTIDDAMKLTKESDFSAYVQSGIDPDVQQLAMKKLFSDPRYNIMDGLDIYTEDYSNLESISVDMLKKMNQSQMLGLFKTDEEKLAEQELERIEREEYHQRLKVLEDEEAADEKALADANSETDVSPSAINDENSAKSSELTDSQESTDVPVVNVEVKTQTKT